MLHRNIIRRTGTLAPKFKFNLHIQSFKRSYSTPDGAENLQNTLIHIPKADVLRFGDPSFARPVFRGLQWTVKEDEAWAVIGSGSSKKVSLFRMLLGRLRVTPPPPPPAGMFPFITLSPSEPPRDPYRCISIVSFNQRARAADGAFYDYTARYGAVREEDGVTLRQSMFPESLLPAEFGLNTKTPETPVKRLSISERLEFDGLVLRLGLGALLDLPLIALSNGQTRRARILKAIMSKPELLLLDEPLTGLDAENRRTLLMTLDALHSARTPRIIMGLRTQDPVPEWITHVAFVKDETVLCGPKEEILPAVKDMENEEPKPATSNLPPVHLGKALVEMKDVNVKYGKRKVLKKINWEIRQGERWHLQGTNGSGKTTLLSLLTGDHPQSYTQPHLRLHGRPRRGFPTAHLHALTGFVSPELFDAFPRHAWMRVSQVVGTGFDGGFVPKGAEGIGEGVLAPLDAAGVRWRVQRCREVLGALGPGAWRGDDARLADESSVEEFGKRHFVDLTAGEQRMVLLMRALVGKPPLVLLDEVWSGMDEGMVRAAKKYLREGGVDEEQAVVVITHWENEVPWGPEDGVKRFKLEGGKGTVEV